MTGAVFLWILSLTFGVMALDPLCMPPYGPQACLHVCNDIAVVKNPIHPKKYGCCDQAGDCYCCIHFGICGNAHAKSHCSSCERVRVETTCSTCSAPVPSANIYHPAAGHLQPHHQFSQQHPGGGMGMHPQQQHSYPQHHNQGPVGGHPGQGPLSHHGQGPLGHPQGPMAGHHGQNPMTQGPNHGQTPMGQGHGPIGHHGQNPLLQGPNHGQGPMGQGPIGHHGQTTLGQTQPPITQSGPGQIGQAAGPTTPQQSQIPMPQAQPQQASVPNPGPQHHRPGHSGQLRSMHPSSHGAGPVQPLIPPVPNVAALQNSLLSPSQRQALQGQGVRALHPITHRKHNPGSHHPSQVLQGQAEVRKHVPKGPVRIPYRSVTRTEHFGSRFGSHSQQNLTKERVRPDPNRATTVDTPRNVAPEKQAPPPQVAQQSLSPQGKTLPQNTPSSQSSVPQQQQTHAPQVLPQATASSTQIPQESKRGTPIGSNNLQQPQPSSYQYPVQSSQQQVPPQGDIQSSPQSGNSLQPQSSTTTAVQQPPPTATQKATQAQFSQGSIATSGPVAPRNSRQVQPVAFGTKPDPTTRQVTQETVEKSSLQPPNQPALVDQAAQQSSAPSLQGGHPDDSSHADPYTSHGDVGQPSYHPSSSDANQFDHLQPSHKEAHPAETHDAPLEQHETDHPTSHPVEANSESHHNPQEHEILGGYDFSDDSGRHQADPHPNVDQSASHQPQTGAYQHH